jgi:phosphotriesterase-related protein
MATVSTVRGPVNLDALGATLMHEHVFVLSTEILENYPADWDEDARVDDAVAKLTELKSRGVATIVDPTVVGLGRYIPRIARVNERVDINIVVATGMYISNELPFYFHYRGPGTMFGGPEPMVEMFTRDIVEGIAGTNIKAAFLKCVVEERGLTPGVERVLRAVAATHRATGVPITVHTNVHHKTGLLAQKILREEGADLGKVVIGHSGDSTDLPYLIELMEAGSLLGMDRFGLDMLLPFERRVDTVAHLCKLGYAEKLVLAHDASCFIDWFPAATKAVAAPNWHYTHIHDDVLPALRDRGVSDAQIATMLVDNPRRYFAHAG